MSAHHAPALAVALAVTGCFENTTKAENGTDPTVCTPGETQVCVCPSGASGSQSCAMDGTAFGECECGNDTSSGSTSGGSSSGTTSGSTTSTTGTSGDLGTTTGTDGATDTAGTTGGTETDGVPGSGDVCDTPFTIPGMPFDHSGNSADFTDRHAVVEDACNQVFLDFGFGGADVVYAFTPTRNYHYGFTVAPNGWDAAIYVLETCDPAPVCVAGTDVFLASGEEIVTPYLTAGQTYYVVIDGYEAADAGPYLLTADVRGESCSMPIPVGLYPFTQAGATAEATDDEAYNGSCAGVAAFGAASPDVVYNLNLPDSGTYRISVDANFDAGLYVFEDCNASACLGASNASGGGQEQVEVALQADTDYFVVVDGAAINAAGTYTLDVELL